MVSLVSVDIFLSDHAVVTGKLSIPKCKPLKDAVQYRKLKNIDLTLLSNDVADNLFVKDPCTNISNLVSQYNNTPIHALNKHVPL